MPVLRNKRTGRDENVPDQLIEQAAASGDYDIPDDVRVTLTTPAGRVVSASPADVALGDGALEARAATPAEAGSAERAAYIEQEFSGPGDTAAALLGQAANAATFGGFDALVGSARGADYGDTRRAQVEANPVASVAGTIAGSVAPALLSGGAGAAGAAARLTPAGAAAQLGTRIAGGGGAGMGRAAAGFGVEGALTGLGQGAAELALAKDPLTVERAASVLSTNVLLGGALGGGIGVVAKAAEKGIIRATGLVREAGANWRAQQGVASDLAGLDAAGLRAAEEAELATIGATRTAAKEAVANDVVTYHQDARAAKPWLATKGDDEFKELGKKALKADIRVRNLLDNPHALAENPKPARVALQQQQKALEDIVAARPRIEAKISAEVEAAKPPTPAAAPAPEAPAGPIPSKAVEEMSVAERMDWAFTRLNTKGDNFVPIAALRAELTDVPREVFDAELKALAKRQHFSPQADPEAAPELIQGGFRSGDKDYTYLSRGGEQTKLVEPVAGPATARDAFRFYQTFGYRNINKALRGDARALKDTAKEGEFGFQATAQERLARESVFVNDLTFDNTVKLMDDAIAQSRIPQPMSVYRGHDTFSVNGERPDVANLKVGDVIDADPAYTSTTSTPEWASTFAEKTMMKIDLPEGSPAARVLTGKKADLEEVEYLLPRGTSFRVKNITHGYEVKNPAKRHQEFPDERVLIELEPVFPPGLTAATTTTPAPAAAVPGASRLAALDSAAELLERNKQLQQRIADLYAEPQSEKLKAIASAKEAIARAPQRGLLQEAATPYAVAAVAGLLPGGPLGAAAAIAAPRVVRKMSDWVFGRLQRASAESIARTDRALNSIVSGTKKTAGLAPPIATKVLMGASFGPPETDRRGEPVPVPKTLAGAYKAREREILSQVEAGPNGKPVMRMAARKQVADRLAGVASVAPALADKLESAVARVIEYLADKLPKRPDMGAMQLGPDRWQPSDIQMRTFARVVAAVRDPGGVEERLASGMVTPEEAQAYRDVWPERFADVQRKLIGMLPAMRGRIPFERRLALTIFTGVPLDPSLSPALIRTMQSMYELEPGTESGTQPPVAQPAFGSMSKEQPTPAQRRAGE